MSDEQERDEDDLLVGSDWLNSKLKEWHAYVAKHVAAERERCAKICDDMAVYYRERAGVSMEFADGEEVATELANRIRGKQ